jgi:transposase
MSSGVALPVRQVDFVASTQPPQPSYEELAVLVVELKFLVSAQAATIAEQAERIVVLERQVAADSHNSSKPPSGDGLRKKPAPKSLRQPSGRKPGRVKGDPGERLERSLSRTR